MALNDIGEKWSYMDPNVKIQNITGPYKNLYDFTDQYFPELIGDYYQMYGDQTIRGFIAKYAKYEGVSADTQYFGEAGRRRKVLDGVTRVDNVFTKAAHTIRKNETFIVIDNATGKVDNAICVEATAGTFTAKSYDGATFTVGTSGLTIIPNGYEFQKGSPGMTRALVSEIAVKSATLIIGKDMYEINGSDMCDKTWLTAPDGSQFWFNANVEEALQRMLDQLEIQAFTGVKAAASSAAKGDSFRGVYGVFDQIRNEGNSFSGVVGSTTDVESIVKRLDRVNGEKYNMMYLSTEASLSIDKWIGSVGGNAAPTWGYFGNDKDFLKFGFDGFSMGGYEFYKSTWKLLKDPTVLNPDNFPEDKQVHGIMMPLGNIVAQTGYNGDLSGNTTTARVPYITMLYKEMPGYSRKLVTTFHGSQRVPSQVGTDTNDLFGIDWLSEWGIRAMGLKRWMIFEGK